MLETHPIATQVMGAGPLALLGAALTLVSYWKPVVLLLAIIPWAWLITNVFDKHALRFYLPREQWNAGHLVVGVVAVLAAFLMPVPVAVSRDLTSPTRSFKASAWRRACSRSASSSG